MRSIAPASPARSASAVENGGEFQLVSAVKCRSERWRITVSPLCLGLTSMGPSIHRSDAGLAILRLLAIMAVCVVRSFPQASRAYDRGFRHQSQARPRLLDRFAREAVARAIRA